MSSNQTLFDPVAVQVELLEESLVMEQARRRRAEAVLARIANLENRSATLLRQLAIEYLEAA